MNTRCRVEVRTIAPIEPARRASAVGGRRFEDKRVVAHIWVDGMTRTGQGWLRAECRIISYKSLAPFESLRTARLITKRRGSCKRGGIVTAEQGTPTSLDL